MANITYTDKNHLAVDGTPERQWRDVDANEVKTVVNGKENTGVAAAAQAAAQAYADGLVVGLQATLVSGTNIKTINGASVLGPGDLSVSGSAPYALRFPLVGAYYSAIKEGINVAALALAANSIRAYACPIEESFTFDRIVTEVTTGSGATHYRIGIYTDNGSAYPGSLIANTDAVEYDSASSGIKTGTPAANVTLSAGMYWVCVLGDGAPTLRYFSALGSPATRGFLNTSGFSIVSELRATQTYGAMPSTYPAGATAFSTALLAVLFRKA